MLQIELVNQFKNWEIKKGRKYTDQSQQDAFPGDKGLAFAHESKKILGGGHKWVGGL